MSESSLPLVTRACSESREAVEKLLLRHLPGLRAWLHLRMGARLRTRETPEDLVQSVAREALGELGGFEWRGEAAFRHWLYLKAQRKLLDKARHVGAERRTPDREVDVARPATEQTLVASCMSPSGELQSLEELQRIEQVFRGLPEDYQEAISLRRLCQMDYEQIADRMQRSVPAVRNLVYRGLSRLALQLSDRRGG